jgi:dipeptidyl-peptidase-3
MIDCYIESFKTGSIKKHVESQRWWVKDKKPVVETNIGWIETYIDPMGVRAYFEVFLKFYSRDLLL